MTIIADYVNTAINFFTDASNFYYVGIGLLLSLIALLPTLYAYKMVI